MISINDLKQGKIVRYNNEPYIIIEYQHSRTAQRRAFVRTRLRHLTNNSVLEKTFNSSDKIEEANVERKNANYLYNTGDSYYFMDEENYEEISFPKSELGLIPNFLKDGMKVIILYCDGQPATVEVAKKVTLEIKDTEPAVRGNTASGNVMKDAVLETGHHISVPIFVQRGEKVVINTDNGEYVERSNE